jgi:hypothetical protein
MLGIWNQMSVTQCVVKKGGDKSSRFSIFFRRKKRDKTINKRDETVNKRDETRNSRRVLVCKRGEMINKRCKWVANIA